MIPIPFLAGYSLAVSHKVMNGDPQPLPEWEEWGKLFMDGLYVMVAQFVYTLPFWILACVGFVVALGSGALSEVSEGAAITAMITSFSLTFCLGALLWLAIPTALFIGTIGAVSVFKAVYIDRRELRCACVGGDSNVPLGFISLTENLMMIAMAVWMMVK